MKHKKKILGGLIAIVAIMMLGFMSMEPVVSLAGTGASPQSDAVDVSANVTSEISISSPTDVSMSPSIPGITGGTANNVGSPTTWNVSTNDTSGWELALQYNHVLRKGSGGSDQTEFDDYTETSAGTPDYSWGSVGSGNEEFGFNVSSGSEVIQKWLDDGSSSCNSSGGNATSNHCWSPLSTSNQKISEDTSQTSSSGIDTSVEFQAQAGSSNDLEEGTFTTTVTATATTK
jgi:hypothetical protein